ncbi:hypothetical protein ACLKA7_011611 [Drosophila subpalustris]
MPFTVITDHASLQWLTTLKDLSGRLARWSLSLQAFNFNVAHSKGKDNVVADMLSRPFDVEELNLFEFETTAFEDEEYVERVKVVQENPQFPDLRVEEDLLFKRVQFEREDSQEFHWKLWIPEALTSTLIQQAHEGENRMHGGIAKTLARIEQFYYWPRMTVQVRETVLASTRARRRSTRRRYADLQWAKKSALIDPRKSSISTF